MMPLLLHCGFRRIIGPPRRTRRPTLVDEEVRPPRAGAAPARVVGDLVGRGSRPQDEAVQAVGAGPFGLHAEPSGRRTARGPWRSRRCPLGPGRALHALGLGDAALGENREVRNSQGLLGPGLDIRGEGGYVLVAPSQTTGPYAWTDRSRPAGPDWLLRCLEELEKRGLGERLF
jgi:hypothetical protein